MILIIDDKKIKEEGCYGCPARDWQDNMCQMKNYYDKNSDLDDIEYGHRPNWCPLLSEPKVAEFYLHNGFKPEDDSWQRGWNDCLKAIMHDWKDEVVI